MGESLAPLPDNRMPSAYALAVRIARTFAHHDHAVIVLRDAVADSLQEGGAVEGKLGYTYGTWLNPLIGVRNTVVVVCGQLVKTGSADEFNVNNYDVSRNGTCG